MDCRSDRADFGLPRWSCGRLRELHAMVMSFIKDPRFKIGVIALAGIFGIWRVVAAMSPSAAQRACDNPLFIDAVTGKTFHAVVHVGETMPVTSPYTGRKTGYPVAWSWWSRSGRPLVKPQAVLMNSWIGKKGPTFAPQSGRLVYPMETRPYPGEQPPPTKQQYQRYMVAAALGNPRSQ